MKRLYFLVLFFSFVLSGSLFSQKFVRMDTISVLPIFQNADFSNILAGVDLDKDGNPEIYAANGNMNDNQDEMIPMLIKFERQNGKWSKVWSTTLDLPAQNSWPALTVGDLDKDGKQEVIWGPTNYVSGWDTTQYPGIKNDNPTRVAVFEARGDGSEGLGVEFFGSTIPNAKFTITTLPKQQIRPIVFTVSDPDGDGKNELIYSDYSSTAGQSTSFGVLSVDKVPDNADGSEKWTIEASGKDAALAPILGVKSKYDVVELNKIIYLWESTGYVFPVKYENNTWKALPGQQGIAGTTGSWKSAQVVDLNGDGKKEIVFGGWSDGKVYLCQQQGDTLVSTQIGNFAKLGVTRLNGGASGDLDGDGKLDFVFGPRADKSKPVLAVCRLQYKGGAITDSNSYAVSIIDSLIHPTSGQIDAVQMADVDKDGKMEVIYTSGYGRGAVDRPRIPIVILKYQGPSSVERENTAAPSSYYMTQNYPNPFNPSTAIKFGLQKDANVSLRVFNILGQQVATIIDNQQMNAGTYNVNFDASSLSSGTYIYQLSYDNQIITKKMQLMK